MQMLEGLANIRLHRYQVRILLPVNVWESTPEICLWQWVKRFIMGCFQVCNQIWIPGVVSKLSSMQRDCSLQQTWTLN